MDQLGQMPVVTIKANRDVKTANLLTGASKDLIRRGCITCNPESVDTKHTIRRTVRGSKVARNRLF